MIVPSSCCCVLCLKTSKGRLSPSFCCCLAVFAEGGRRHPFLFFSSVLLLFKGSSSLSSSSCSLIIIIPFILALQCGLQYHHILCPWLAFKFPPEDSQGVSVSLTLVRLLRWREDQHRQGSVGKGRELHWDRWSLSCRCHGPIVNGCVSQRTDGFGSGLQYNHWSQLGTTYRIEKAQVTCGRASQIRRSFGDP